MPTPEQLDNLTIIAQAAVIAERSTSSTSTDGRGCPAEITTAQTLIESLRMADADVLARDGTALGGEAGATPAALARNCWRLRNGSPMARLRHSWPVAKGDRRS